MRMAEESRRDTRRLELGFQAAIFLGLFVYIWKGIQPPLLFHGFGVFTAYPVFSWERSFFQTIFSTPGGVLNALAALLSQTYRNPLLGALVIVAALGALVLGIQRLLDLSQAGRFRDWAWAPPILALMVYNRYDNPLAILLGIGSSVWMAVLYGSIPMRTPPARIGVFLALFVLTYYLTGASALVFAAIVCLTEVQYHRTIVVAIVQAVLAGAAALALGRFLFGLGPRASYTVGTLWDPVRNHEFSTFSTSLTVLLYAFVPGLILAAFLTGRLMALGARIRPARRAKKTRPAGQAGRFWTGVRALVLATAAVLCLTLSRNHIRDERALHAYTQQRDWDRAIALAHRMQGRRVFTRPAIFDIDRALAHRGRLGEELCAYPQDETKTLFLSFPDMAGRVQHAKLLELYLDLGCPNAAQKNAYELLDNEGPSPYVLEALVRIHLVKGEYESARIALGALRRYAGGGPYVRRWQGLVADPARAEGDPLLQAWRRVRGTVDQAIGGISFEPMLKRSLQDTPGHRLAFEYLMAHYLLKHQRAEFMSCLPLLRPLGYDRLPRQYAEAVLVHALETRTPPGVPGWTIEPEVQNRFREISGLVKSTRGSNQAAFDTLAPKFGGTYTFYSMFNVCGVK